jgi:hypothetical protein
LAGRLVNRIQPGKHYLQRRKALTATPLKRGKPNVKTEGYQEKDTEINHKL